jgi:hypothetical protein
MAFVVVDLPSGAQIRNSAASTADWIERVVGGVVYACDVAWLVDARHEERDVNGSFASPHGGRVPQLSERRPN